MALRRRGPGHSDDDGLNERLLGSDGDDLHKEYDYSDDEAGAGPDGRADSSDPLRELIKAIGQSLTICASQVCTYLAWLLRGLARQDLTPQQLEQLDHLKSQLEDKFDHDKPDHQEALAELWSLCFPDDGPVVYKSQRWKDAGFQGTDPATDFRGGGLYALHNLLYMGRRHPETFQRLLHKRTGDRAELEYPFCVAGINITFDLQELIGLRHRGRLTEGQPSTVEGRAFAVLLTDNPDAFEELYVCTFELLDRLWLDSKASYFEFQHIITTTLACVKNTLSLKPRDIAELRQLMLQTRASSIT